MRAQETATTWWLTGLPGAGKTTLAQALAHALRQRGKPVCVIDGDELRAGLCQDLGFDDASRAENVRRAHGPAIERQRHPRRGGHGLAGR